MLLSPLSRLLAHLAFSLFTKESFTPGDALGTVAHDKARVLSVFGLAQQPKKLGE